MLVVSLVVVAVAGAIIFAVHYFQANSLAYALAERAESLQKKDPPDFAGAANYLHRFLQMRPDDVEKRVELAKIYHKAADTPAKKIRSLELQFRAIAATKDAAVETSLRTTAIEILLELRRFDEAEKESKELLEADSDSAVGLRFLALSAFGVYQTTSKLDQRSDELEESLKDALDANKDDIELAVLYANFIRKNDITRAEEADDLVEEAAQVAISTAPGKAYLAHYYYLKQHYSLSVASEKLFAAETSAPDDLAVRLALGEYYLELGKSGSSESESHLHSALKYFQLILDENDPSNEFAHLGKGEVFLQKGDTKAAVKHWKTGSRILNDESFLLSTRLTDGLIAIGDLEAAETELKSVQQFVKRTGPLLSPNNRLELERSVEFLTAVLRGKQGRWVESAGLLTRVAQSPVAVTGDDLQVKAFTRLGEAYAQLQQLDRSIGAFEILVELNSDDPATRFALARILLQANRTKEAVKELQRTIELEPLAEARMLLAQAHLQLQSQRPPSQRDWDKLDEIIIELKASYSELARPWRADILATNASILKVKDGVAEVEELEQELSAIKSKEDKFDTPEFLRNLMFVYQRANRTDDAERVLQRYLQSSEDEVQKVVAQATFDIRRNEIEKAKEAYRNILPKLEGRPRSAILNRLAQLTDSNSEQGLRALHEEFPEDLDLVVRLAESALVRPNSGKEAIRWEQELKNREGASGPNWRYCRVRRLLNQARGKDDAMFREAVSLFRELANSRPQWPKTHILKGLIAEKQGLKADAVTAYRRAIELGDQRVDIRFHLFRMLTSLERFEEAQEVVQELGTDVAYSAPLTTLALTNLLNDNQTSRAEELAAAAVLQRPTDLEAYIWQGQVLLLAKKPEDAERVLTHAATNVAPSDVRAWQALIAFYIDRKRFEDAEKAINKAVDKANFLKAGDKEFYLAQWYESIGKTEKARESFKSAGKLSSEKSKVLFRHARFEISQRKMDDAESLLRAGLQIDAKDRNAVRGLATILSLKGTQESWDEIDNLLRSNEEDLDYKLDKRLLAILLARRGKFEYLDQAAEILEELIAGNDAVVGDKLLLGAVYVKQSRRPSLSDEVRREMVDAADAIYSALASKPDADPTHIRVYVNFLLENNQNEKAAEYVKTLQQGSLADLALEIRWLVDNDDRKEAKKRIAEFAEQRLAESTSDAQKSSICKSVAALYAANDFVPEAEQWYRKLIEFDPKGYVYLAPFLARNSKVDEAITIGLNEARNDTTEFSAIFLASLLTMPGASSSSVESSEKVLADAMDQFGDKSPNLLLAVANMHAANHQNAKAIELYHRVLELQPENGMAMNNLATMLAENPATRADAIEWIDNAIKSLGPRAELYDTKGMVLVHMGDTSEAVSMFEYAITFNEPDPRYHFHLAIAYFRLERLEESKTQLDKALAMNLEGQILTAEDTAFLKMLQNGLNEQK